MYRPARFIWTPQILEDDRVGFGSLLMQGPQRRDDGVNRWFLFRREFDLPDGPLAGVIDITADSAYRLEVNGTRVARGPARAAPGYLRLDRHDIGAQLHHGRNVIAVLVHVYGVDTAWYETSRDYAQSIFGDGGLYVDAAINCGGQELRVLSDTSWRVLQAMAWRQDSPRSGWGQGFIEEFDARAMPEGWTEPGFDDSAWLVATELHRPASEADLARGWGDIEPFPGMRPSELPSLCEQEEVLPSRLVAIYETLPAPGLDVDARLYREPLAQVPEQRIEGARALLEPARDATRVCTEGEHCISLLLEFDRRHCGYPFIEIEAQGGEVIEVAVAETVPGQYTQRPAALPRVAVEAPLGCAHVFRYIAKPGRQRFEKFEWTAVKFLQLVVRNAPQGLRILRVGSRQTRYPLKHEGRFTCSDPLLTRLWEVGRYTVEQCTHDAWEDCPGREKRQWLGDGLVHYLVNAAAFGTSSLASDRHFLLQAVESQRDDGLLQMFAPGDHHQGGLVIPDFSLHWIGTAEAYLRHTRDIEAIAGLLPAAQRVLGWFAGHVGPSGLLADIPHWHFVEWARVERRGESFCINALWLGALEATASMAAAVGYPRLQQECLERGATVRKALRARHFDPERGVFVDSVDPASGQRRLQVSQHANALAILHRIALPGEWPAIVDYITDPQRLRFTAVPPVTMRDEALDPATDVVRVNTFFAHFLYAAMGQAGRMDVALSLMREGYGPMLEAGTETLWETFEPTASLCHAFSATPVHQLSAHVLGVSPLEPGFARVRIAPQVAGLEWAAGAYPTPHGPIEVEWSRAPEGCLELGIRIPESMSAEFLAPAGMRLQVSGELGPGLHRLRLLPAG